MHFHKEHNRYYKDPNKACIVNLLDINIAHDLGTTVYMIFFVSLYCEGTFLILKAKNDPTNIRIPSSSYC